MMLVVCDATPLIFLAKLSDIELLKTLYQKIYIPREVYDDVAVRGIGRPGEKELRAAKKNWVEVRTVSNFRKVKDLHEVYGVGKGEAAAMVLAQELKVDLFLTDDRPPRRLALELFQGTTTAVSGTIGVLKLARERGLISGTQLKSKIDFLRQEGFYLKDTLYQQILKEAGE